MSASNSKRRWGWLFGLGLLLLAAQTTASAQTVTDDLVAAGRRIYMDGVLPSGAPLEALRFGNVPVSGAKAACVQCHRKSGMGAVEGDVLISPITGNYLFNPPDKTQLAVMDQRVSKSFNLSHPAYDDATLGRAVRQGMNANGLSMNNMMPRYTLDDASFQALGAYLRQLTTQWSPGVSGNVVRFATIIAPGVDPARKKIVLDMLRMIVRQKNANTALGSKTGGRRHMATAAELVLGTERKWELDIWELQGEPSTWSGQLQALYAKAPVFAVLSGISESTWEPVHAFCEAQKVPCWFPVVDAPVAGSGDFYSLYFSRGVLLEAEVLGRQLKQAGPTAVPQVVQIFRDDDTGRAAAEEFARHYSGSGTKLQSHAWTVGDHKALQQLLAQVPAPASVVLWLRSSDMAALGQKPRQVRKAVYFSGQLLADAKDVPLGWRAQARLVYPYEMPEKRELNLAYFYQWIQLRRMPLVDEPLQSKVYFAAAFLTDTMVDMLENLYRDYLLERAENMISRREGSRAEEEAHSSQSMHRIARAKILQMHKDRASGKLPADVFIPKDRPEDLGERQSTTVYPRLTLAAGQRFASKGAQIVKFVDPASGRLAAESPWLIP